MGHLPSRINPPAGRQSILTLTSLVALVPACLLALALLGRTDTSLARSIGHPPSPSPTPSAVVLAREPAATPVPSPTPEPTFTPVPPTPTVDATEVLARASVVARLFPPTPRPTVTPAQTFYWDKGVYRRAGAPITLRIPKIGVDAPVESVGLDPTGAMATPTTPFRVAWYVGGAVPGEPGNAVIDGHLDSRVYGAAVFWRLGELVPGDRIEVELPGQRWLTFVVERTAIYPYNDAPLNEIFGPSDEPRLNLITCSGTFDRSSHNYDRRRVVFAKLADPADR